MSTVTQTLRDYYDASNKDDLPGMVSYYHEPVTFMGAGGVTSYATRAEAIPLLAQFFGRLRGMGAMRTEWTESHIKELGDTLAVADIGLARFTTDGREVERTAFTYLLHKTDAGWKIAVLASHPADSMLHVDR
jgi:ketosteroid isomerase-like protein